MRIWRLFFVFLWQFWNEPMGWVFFSCLMQFLLFFKAFCNGCIKIFAVESCHLLLINFRTCLKLMLLRFCAILKVNTEVDLKSTNKYQHDTHAMEPMQPLPLPAVQWWRCDISGWAVNFQAVGSSVLFPVQLEALNQDVSDLHQQALVLELLCVNAVRW